MNARPAVTGAAMPPAALRELLGVRFTDEQLHAATQPLGPGLIVAGAGSGKTAVMTARVVWLIATGAMRPGEVLGLTFTNKAAGELAGRIRAAVHGLLGSGTDPLDEAGEPTVSTYHAYAGRLLAEHGLRIGLEPAARLLADATRYQLAASVVRRASGLIDVTGTVGEIARKVVALDGELCEHLVGLDALTSYDVRIAVAIEAEIERLRGARKKTKGAREYLAAVATTSRRRGELADLVAAYRQEKRDRYLLDFGDQVALAVRLVRERREVVAAERLRFRAVLLDEYQDTSVAQRLLLQTLYGAGHPLTAVGDPCQAVYGWRGASVANLDEFDRHFDPGTGQPAARAGLRVNLRSGGVLLQLANAFSSSLRVRHDVPELQPLPAVEQAGRTVVALHETWAQETEWVAATIARLLTEDPGLRPRDIAVLVRLRSSFADLHAALADAGVPVEVVGLGGLLSLPEVADVLATLRLIDDPTANDALLRLLAGPRWLLGRDDLRALGERAAGFVRSDRRPRPEPAAEVDAEALMAEVEREEAKRQDAGIDGIESGLDEAAEGVDAADVVALSDALTSPGQAGWSPAGLERVQAFAAELRELRRHAGDPLLDLVRRVVETIGLDVEVAATPEALRARRRESLAAFLDVAGSFADLEGEASLPALLAFLDAAEEHDRGLDAAGPSGADAVQLLTVHKAKGLEWKVVVLPNLTRTVFPFTGGTGRWTTTCEALPYPLRGDAAGLPVEPLWTKQGLDEFKEQWIARQAVEERRLGYVAVTRARDLLVASSHWWGPTQKKPRGPSEYWQDIRAHALAGGGSVEVEAPHPADKHNPYLQTAAEHAWPAPLDPVRVTSRREAAALVLAAVTAGTEELDEAAAGLCPVEAAEVAEWDADLNLLLAEAAAAITEQHLVQLPRTLSATQLLRLGSDPEALASDLARPMPRRPVPAARRGTRFHMWVESLFGQRPLLDPDDIPGAADDGPADDAELGALQEAFLATRWATRQPFAVEAPFELVLAGRVVRGRIDAVYAEPDGGWHVVDWKTGTELADPLQLAIYRTAWARLRGVAETAVRASFLIVRTGELVTPGDLLDAPALERLLLDP